MTKQLFDDFKCDISSLRCQRSGLRQWGDVHPGGAVRYLPQASTGDIQTLRWLEEHDLLTFKKRGKAGTWP